MMHDHLVYKARMARYTRGLSRDKLPTLVHHTYRKMRGAVKGVLGRLRSRSGLIARLARHPRPMSAPWRRDVLDVGRPGAMGDVLMCTPALRELKKRNPSCYVRFYTDFPTLVRGLAYLDEVLPWNERPTDMIAFRYEDAIPPRAHIARIIGDNLGLNVRDVRPDCVVEASAVKRAQESWHTLPRPYVVVQRRASRHTPNKDWPDKYWIELIESLSERTGVIEIGTQGFKQKSLPQNYIDLCNRTPVAELVAVIAAADIVVGPCSGPMHIAAAVGTPAVVIYGGYEDPISTSYAGNVDLYTPLACAPCWLKEPCPYNLKCLNMIRSDAVENAVWSAWATRKIRR
jgi:ADP-heptose:LPS heptosyltransferase